MTSDNSIQLLGEISKKAAVELKMTKDYLHQIQLSMNLIPGPVAISDFEETGRGMQALKDIPANSTIVEIPLNLLITKSSIVQNLPGIGPCSDLSEHAALALFIYLLLDPPAMLTDRLLPYSEYAASLPRKYSVLHFNSQCLSHPFIPSHFKADFVRQKKMLQKDLFACKPILARLIPNLKMNKRQFETAWFAVNTRCIYLSTKVGTSIALAPFLDMFNHHPLTSTTVKMSINSYTLVTDSVWEKGQQVFINYGPHCNWKLWLEYGFVLKTNTGTVSILDKLRLNFPLNSVVYKWRWDVLDQLGLVTQDVCCLPATFGLKCALNLLLGPQCESQLDQYRVITHFKQIYFSGNFKLATVDNWLESLQQQILTDLQQWLKAVDTLSPLKVILQDSVDIIVNELRAY